MNSRRSFMRDMLDTPWKVRGALWGLVTRPWIRLKFGIAGVRWGRNWTFYGVPILQKHRRSRMSFGSGLKLRSAPPSNPLGINHRILLATTGEEAVLEVGDNFGMSGGCICVAQRVAIGSNVAVGANCTIVDTDFHPLDPDVRRTTPAGGATAPVVIEDDVFIGMNCLILKGVNIGRGSVIGAGSVVAKSIPPGVIAAGNPARIIRELRK